MTTVLCAAHAAERPSNRQTTIAKRTNEWSVRNEVSLKRRNELLNAETRIAADGANLYEKSFIRLSRYPQAVTAQVVTVCNRVSNRLAAWNQ
jgi:hypothetical protein